MDKKYDKVQKKDYLFEDKSSTYREGTGKLMQNIIDFWTETRSMVKKRSELKILVPGVSLAAELRDEYIPWLIEISQKEYHEYSNTMVHFFELLFYYHEITYEIK